MNNQQINRAIQKLKEDLHEMSFRNNNEYFTFVETEVKKRFLEIHRDDDKFEKMKKSNVLIMFRLNLRHKFVALHQFGINIEL